MLTVGGNDAFFYEVASNCIFHDKQPHSYGELYPDPTGECAKSIAKSRKYILSKEQASGQSLEFDLRATYNDLLARPLYASNPHTYHTGYIHFFNIEKEDDWCDETKESFGVIPFDIPGVPHQPLTNALRSDINQLVEEWNNALKTVIADYADRKFSYVEISDRFAGHRYCEKGSDHRKQYYDDDVWLWNVSPPLPDGANPPGDGVPLIFPKEMGKIYRTGLWNTTTTENIGFGTDSANTGSGWMLRPMHPKKDGYTAIKDAIVERMVQDKIRGVKS